MNKGCYCCLDGHSEVRVTFAQKLGGTEAFMVCKDCYSTLRTGMEELRRD